MIYQGDTSALVVLPGDDLQIMPSRLGVLKRSYACASDYADTARGILTTGSAPEGYDYFSLYEKTEKIENGIATFSVTYYGVLSTSDYDQPFVTREIKIREITAQRGYTESGENRQVNRKRLYSVPGYSRKYVIASGSATTLSAPSADTVLNGMTVKLVTSINTTSVSVLGDGSTYIREEPDGSNADLSSLNSSNTTVLLESSNSTDYGSVTEVVENYELSWGYYSFNI